MKLADYCGAGALLSPERGLSLDPRKWAWQVVDGIYARIVLDADGRIASVTSRAGNVRLDALDLIGILAGPPDSVLHGNLVATPHKWINADLFDCTRYRGSDVSAQPFAERYGLLHRAHTTIELDGSGRINPWSRDQRGNLHDEQDGRFIHAVPTDLRRTPVVELHRGPGAAEALWQSHMIDGHGEGLVAVRLDARAGARGAKRRIAATDTIACIVIASDGRAATLAHAGEFFTVSARNLHLTPGALVEVACDGRYASGTPRFARIVRERRDITPRFN